MKILDVDVCRKLKEEGKTYKEIGDYFKVSKQAVFDLLDRAGVKSSKGKYSQYYEEWERLYNEGIGIYLIAKKYNCALGTVHNYLRKKIVITREMNGAKKPASEVVSTGERAL